MSREEKTTMTKEQLTQEQYVASKGIRCPVCQSEDIDAGTIEADGSGASQSNRCEDCGAEWYDIYNLIGYSLCK